MNYVEKALIEEALKLGDKMMVMLSHADFSNGVEAFGSDEGQVKGMEMLREIERDWTGVKFKLGRR